jgi:hypothetical protein
MNEIQAQSTPSQVAATSAEVSPTGAIVRRQGDPTQVQLNASAFAIWNLCDGQTTLSEMAEAIGELTGSPVDETLTEVSRTIEEFYSLGIAVEVSPNSTSDQSSN